MRILTFADGFTSSTAPVVGGASVQEDYVILNSATAETIFTIDGTINKSAFFTYDLKRSDIGGSFTQQGSGIVGFDGTAWSITFGNYQGDSIITENTPSVEEVKFYIDTAGSIGTLKYDSGTMNTSYEGKMSIAITRILI